MKEVSEQSRRIGTLDVTKRVATYCKEVMRRPHGVVFICGPTGMGKTVFAFDYLDARDAPTFFSHDVRSVLSLARTFACARDAHVLGVLRIPGGTGALDRLRDMRDAASLPSLPLAIITLRLLPRLCRLCRRRDGPYYARGTSRCDGAQCALGYDGKVRVVEVLLYDDMQDGKPRASSGSLLVDSERRLGAGLIDVASVEQMIPND